MLIRSVLCVTALAVSASANYIADAFMDRILREMSFAVRQNGLEPVRVMPFQVRVKKNRLTNRNLEANFTQGSLIGLSGINRQGHCTYGSFGSQMKMGCNIAFHSVKMLMNANVVGDNTIRTKHSISTSSTVSPKTFALVQLQGYRNNYANHVGISVRSVTMKTSVVQGKLNLNSNRLKKFVNQTNAQLSNQLVTTLVGTYAAALRTVLSRNAMP